MSVLKQNILYAPNKEWERYMRIGGIIIKRLIKIKQIIQILIEKYKTCILEHLQIS